MVFFIIKNVNVIIVHAHRKSIHYYKRMPLLVTVAASIEIDVTVVLFHIELFLCTDAEWFG